MEDLVTMIATDGNPSDISDKIKEILYTKAANTISELQPYVANSVFSSDDEDSE